MYQRPYKRKTKDIWEIYGNYGNGWAYLTTEESWQAAREQKKCYDINEPYAEHTIKKRRIHL